MNKGVLLGGGAGLLILILLGGYWWSIHAPESQLPAAQTTSPGLSAPAGASGLLSPVAPSGAAPSTAASPGSGSDVPPTATPSTDAIPSAPVSTAPAQAAPSLDKKPLTREERKKIRAEVRTKMTELLAKGQKVTPAETQAFLNDVERLGQGMFDPRYFSTMREMIQYSARTQELSRELTQIGNSKAPKDVERQQKILAELRDIGDRLSNGAAALQSYARDTATGKAP